MQNDKMFMELLREAYDDYLLSFLREEEESKDKTSEPKKRKKRKIKKSHQDPLAGAEGLEINIDGHKYTHDGMEGEHIYLKTPGKNPKRKKTTLSALEELGAEI